MSSRTKSRVQLWLETTAAKSFAGLLKALPQRRAQGLAGAIAVAAHDLLGIRRKHAVRELLASFPERDEAWAKRTVRQVYRHFGMVAADLARLPVSHRRDWRGVVDFAPGSEQVLRDAMAEGHGAVLVSGHIGSWEVMTAHAVSRGYPIHGVVAQQSNSGIEELFDQHRRSAGIQIIKRDRRVQLNILKALRQGDAVAFMIDQDARRHGVFVDFLGRPASTFRGPGLFAVKTGAPVLWCGSLRQPDGSIAYEVARIEIEATGDVHKDAYRYTVALTRKLEAMVREHPEQWLWLHRRWKTAPWGEIDPATGFVERQNDDEQQDKPATEVGE